MHARKQGIRDFISGTDYNRTPGTRIRARAPAKIRGRVLPDSGRDPEIETIAIGRSIRELARLRKHYGGGRWRKRKGLAFVELSNGMIRQVELHWYEASGIGKKEFKIKRFLE